MFLFLKTIFLSFVVSLQKWHADKQKKRCCFPHYGSDSGFKSWKLDRRTSLNRGSLQITLTVPLTWFLLKEFLPDKQAFFKSLKLINSIYLLKMSNFLTIKNIFSDLVWFKFFLSTYKKYCFMKQNTACEHLWCRLLRRVSWASRLLSLYTGFYPYSLFNIILLSLNPLNTLNYLKAYNT